MWMRSMLLEVLVEEVAAIVEVVVGAEHPLDVLGAVTR